jgi:hypothetical protein
MSGKHIRSGSVVPCCTAASSGGTCMRNKHAHHMFVSTEHCCKPFMKRTLLKPAGAHARGTCSAHVRSVSKLLPTLQLHCCQLRGHLQEHMQTHISRVASHITIKMHKGAASKTLLWACGHLPSTSFITSATHMAYGSAPLPPWRCPPPTHCLLGLVGAPILPITQSLPQSSAQKETQPPHPQTHMLTSPPECTASQFL